MTNWENNIASIIIPTPFPVGDVNAFVIKGDALTLIDAGPKTEETERALIAGLKELNLKMSDIEQVILTHHHPDHVGGVDFFSKDLPLLGHENNNYWLNPSDTFISYNETFTLNLAKEFGIPSVFQSHIGELKKGLKYTCSRKLTQSIKEGDMVPGLHGWSVYETPGHAESHIVLYREADGVLIGGDILLQHVSPNPIIEPPMKVGESRPKSQLLLNDSLKRLYQMPISAIYAGHGDIIHNHQALIEKRLASQHNRAMKVKAMLEDEPGTVFQICMKLFPKVFQKQLGLTLSETFAQFDYLMDLDEIKAEETEQGIVYFAK